MPYRAVDRLGQTVDFLLTARRFFERAIGQHDASELNTIDKSGANIAAVRGLLANSGGVIELRQSKYLNNLVEQDQRAVNDESCRCSDSSHSDPRERSLPASRPCT